MERLLGAVMAMLLLSGCRAPAPPNDPFLYRSTVPPPGTMTPSVSPGQPYYPAPAAVPGPTTIPPTISPGMPISPSAAPVGPAGVPVSPATPANRYSPPNGFNYQSSLQTPGAAPQPFNGPTGSLSGKPADSGAIAAGNWQVPKAAPTDSSSVNGGTSQPQIPASVVRIIEPAKTTVPVAPSDSPMPATLSTATVTSATQLQTVERPAVPEITDLPPANIAASVGPKSSAAQTPVNMPAERPGASYGYDPDYKTLRGKLEYSVATRRWKLIYLPPDGPIDEYGGNVVLPDATQLDGFEGGDFVTVQGAFSPPTAGGGAAMFAVQRIKRQ